LQTFSPDPGLLQECIKECLHALTSGRFLVKGAIGTNVRAERDVDVEVLDQADKQMQEYLPLKAKMRGKGRKEK
jgi:hypothetical protein